MTPTAHAIGLAVIVLASAASNALAQSAADSFNARARARAQPIAGESTLQAREAEAQPAALGDAARALTSLSGIARSSFDSGALSIWGGTDSELRVYVDGVELPLLFHPGGFRSSLPESLISGLTLIKGAPGPELGRNLGAVIDLETRALDGASGAVLALDTMNASGSVQGSIGPLRVAWAGRLGYMDRLAHALAPRASEHLPIPEYADGFAKVELDLDRHSQLSAAWLGSHDDYVLGDRGAARSVTQSRALMLLYLRYKRTYGDRARLSVTPFVSTFGTSRLGESAGDAWRLGSQTLRYGVRADYRAEVDQVGVQLGFDAAALRADVARSGTLTLPAREGDISVFGQAPGGEVSSDAWSTHDLNLAPYGSLQLRLGRLTMSPGIRFSIHLSTAERALPTSIAAPAYGRSTLRLQPEPRLALRYFASELLQLSARAGIAHQAPSAEDRSALFGNPALENARGVTVAAGPRFALRDRLSIEVVGFYRHLWQLSARNPARPLPLAAALVADGRGH
ncbi:MAG TPA: TonB-dependent receptor, partial [Polyangiales bacterium]|nr:TonB-dependent receptor [Polyangiales bacterium]